MFTLFGLLNLVWTSTPRSSGDLLISGKLCDNLHYLLPRHTWILQIQISQLEENVYEFSYMERFKDLYEDKYGQYDDYSDYHLYNVLDDYIYEYSY